MIAKEALEQILDPFAIEREIRGPEQRLEVQAVLAAPARRAESFSRHLAGADQPQEGAVVRPPAGVELQKERSARQGLCEYAREVGECLLVFLIGKMSKVAGELQQHPLLRHQFRRSLWILRPRLYVFKKITDVDAQRLRDLMETASRNAVDPSLVFMGLLIGDIDHLRHLLLR